MAFAQPANKIRITKQLYSIQPNKNTKQSIQHIFDIAQDKQGFLYLATNNGIYRYDGFQYDQLNHQLNYYFGGSAIKFHRDGRIFYENFDGHVFSYNQHRQWQQYNTHKPIHFLSYGLFDKYFAFVYKDGIAIYDLHTNLQIRHIPYKSGYPQYAVQDDKYYYIINESKLTKVDDRQILAEYTLPQEDNKVIIHQLYLHDNRIFVTPRSEYERGIRVLDTDLKAVGHIAIPNLSGIINNIQFIDHKIWVLTTAGAFIYREEQGKWIFEQRYFPDASVTDVIKGQKGEYWLSLLGQGLQLIPNTALYTYHLEGELPTTITATADGYILGTRSGKIVQVDHQLSSGRIWNQNKYHSPISFLYKDRAAEELFYVSGVGFNHLHNSKNEFYDNALKAVTILDSDYYALATSSDILLYKRSLYSGKSAWNSLFKKYSKNNLLASIFNGKRSKSISYHVDDRKIYFLSNVGLFSIDQSGREEEVLVNSSPVIAEKMLYIAPYFYFLTYDGLLLAVGPQRPSRYRQISENVLDVKSIHGQLVLRTTAGFEIYNPKSSQLEKVKSVIPTLSITDFSYDSHGNLIAITDAGIMQIPKYSSQQPIDQRSFHITQMLVNGKEVPLAPYNKLGYTENSIQFQFAWLDFSSPTLPKLSYRMNGGAWERLPSSSRTLQFHQLSAGDYQVDFKLDETLVREKIKFHIAAPFWKSWVFYMLLTSVVITIVILYYQYKRRLLKQHIQLLEEKVLLEKQLGRSILTSIKAQMNPHFFFNALNSIQAFIYKNDQQQAISYLSKFSKLTRIILRQTDVEQIQLSDEIHMLQLYLDLEAVRFNHSFTYEILCSPNISKETVYIPAMLIQPYVENCIKHGFLQLERQGHILVSFQLRDATLEVEIRDNGIGRVRAQELQQHRGAASFSTQANRKRLDILNQQGQISIFYADLLDEQQHPVGTSVKLNIPINP